MPLKVQLLIPMADDTYFLFIILFLAVWTADALNSKAVLEIGRKLKERLHIPSRTVLGYQVHKDTMEKTGSMQKYSYTV